MTETFDQWFTRIKAEDANPDSIRKVESICREAFEAGVVHGIDRLSTALSTELRAVYKTLGEKR